MLPATPTCSRYNEVRVQDLHDGWSTTLNGCSPWKSPGYDVTTADRSAVLVIDLQNLNNDFKLNVQITPMNVSFKDDPTRYVSPGLGYIQTPSWHPFARPSYRVSGHCAQVAAAVPRNHVTLISVVQMYLKCLGDPTYFKLNAERKDGSVEKVLHLRCIKGHGERLLADFTKLHVDFSVPEAERRFFHGVRVLFSFHQPSITPQQNPGGLWNCSVPFWPDFRLHFVCNNKAECIEREDETGCPDLSCQHGGILIDDACYFILRLPRWKATWHHGNSACKQQGAALATFPTVKSWYHLAVIGYSRGYTGTRCYIGLQSPDLSYPHITLCLDQHWTQDFLACDSFSRCWHGNDARFSDVNVTKNVCVDVDVTSFRALFPCRNGASSVPYSLVCNHLQDCPDNSDEDFCVFPPCSGVSQYKCTNGQCLQRRHNCDEIVQCVDESDEADCIASENSFSKQILRPRPPVMAHLDGRGWMAYTSLTTWSEKNAKLCPDTHVFCPGDGYCLPVYIRCNGLYDCPGHEDEVGCDSYTCPGLYRCRGLLSICLHPDHLCDGWPQCPQHDDEIFCNLTCPVDCSCLGHAFTCTSDFHVELFSRLRYLDASGVGLEPGRLVNNRMLAYLNLTNCGLTHLGNLTLSNLLSLDLSNNNFSVVTIAELNLMENLQNLSLARNPLSKLFSGNYSTGFLVHENILHVYLTGVKLKDLIMPSHLPFPGLLSLNLSQSGVTRLIGDGFRSLTSLRILDLRGCPMTVFPRLVLKTLKNLQLVFADNYKLCCEANLPEDFNVNKCQAPFNEISSCDALLRTDVYRVCLSVLAALALSGNLGCFSLRIFSLSGRGKTGFNVFVTHLCVSDFVMGVYMAMIGVADRMYLGRYLWEEDRWRLSAACQVTGILALLSSEVSAFIICLITLDRFLVIRFPFSRLRFSSLSAQVAVLMTWTVGVVLVTVPFLPVTGYRHFYSQTGICVPLPVTRHDFAGQHYAFGVMILLNLVIFLIIAVGQICVYHSMTSNAMSSIDMTRKSRDLIVARRLITVVVSDFLCWFPLGLLGVLATQGVPVPGEVNVAMAIFVLPLNSALNPFLYTLNMILEKRRRATEVKLLKLIMDLGVNDNENANKV